ncbi:tRNA delta(2)-isopentenylpyrophosphate transferase [Nitrosococcus halophilus Nc 4]|uniref:tRNA dimethylallyltransferase n=1 Tax=Nitrosococcus halophilus (strain Nc4) TaxID=472759 RepID=D5C2S4_NITHN|nr:tRNA (adenosine(37)-N6)-dimethylallyltransferase MiaA [Nitrosococcus halophilus]ADE16749.1 tRNA delta(2)-isopentenylpyrophosphate transferase [Nitrosococcus halophilus Nc 4]
MLTRPPALFLMGPTASGKTELALMLAKHLPCEIISVDSAQVYRGMDIGTAKPNLTLRHRYPHHLIDILDPADTYSAGRFRADALALMKTINQRGRIPLLVGGTMLYFHALRHGISPLPPANPEVRAAIDREAMAMGWEALHRRLAELDPVAAQRIHRHDPQRIQRALEVFQLTGRPLSELIADTQEAEFPYRVIKLILAPRERASLHTRIEQRFYAMLEAGFLEEVNDLFKRPDLSVELSSIRAVGYRQAWLYLQGRFSFPAMVEQAITATRQMAKRQLTWLRREEDAIHVDPDEKDYMEKAWQQLEAALT